MRIAIGGIALSLFFLVLACANHQAPEPSNQGRVFQYPDGNITVFLNNRGFKSDPNISRRSVFIAYVFRRADYGLECAADPEPEKCESKLIFRNEKIDSLAFSNEPGFYGYDTQWGYSPILVSDLAQGDFPATRPPDPEGMQDPDIWQCYYSNFHGGYRCGINNNPIRYLDLSLSQFHMPVYAADGKGFPSTYLVSYNKFQSLNHPVQDGNRFFMYLAVHYEAIREDSLAENRFLASSSIFQRPVVPDLISPRIPIKIKLLAEGPYDAAGSVYDIPDFRLWYHPGCAATTGLAADSLVFSEILWSGSQNTDGVADSQDEFFEIYNRTANSIVMSGYRIQGMSSGSSEIILPDCTIIEPNGVITVHRKTGAAFNTANLVFSTVAIANSGKVIRIRDKNNTVIHELDCSASWSGRGSNGTPKRSMQLLNPNTVPTSCNNYVTTSVDDTNYAMKSIKINASHLAADDTSPGTVATPGFP